MNVNRKLVPLILAIIVFIGLILAGWYTKYKIESLKNQQYHQESKNIKQELNRLISAKKRSSTAIAILISQDSSLKQMFKNPDSSSIGKKLKNISEDLRQNTDYRNVWIQIIDKNGVSIGRSWESKTKEPLAHIRADIRNMIQNPQISSDVSTGKFSMTLKSMVPIFDDKNKEFLGSVEVVTHFNSIIDELRKMDVSSLVLADKRYQNQLTKSITKTFIDGYYVVNFVIDKEKVKMLHDQGVENFIDIPDYKISNNYFFTSYSIKSLRGDTIGYFILMKDLNTFKYKGIEQFITSIIIIISTGLLLSLITILFFYVRNRDMEKQKTYFKNIIDSSSEIIIISDTKRPLDVNKAFFEFFDEFRTLQEFEKTHGCLCNLFEKDEGFLQKEMGGYGWVEYVHRHPNAQHKVKIIHKSIPYYFSIHLKILNNSDKRLYTIVLTDITKMKIYQDELENLSQTDSLTKIGNREFFNQSIQKEIDRAKRYNAPLSLIMLDIDFFKNINDTYGHDIGDLALVTMTDTIQKLLRKTDLFCRYGGEEFMIILPENGVTEAKISAERIRTHVEKMSIKPIETLTISIGVTQLVDDDTIESFIKRVDNALYQSKAEGRNCIRVF